MPDSATARKRVLIVVPLHHGACSAYRRAYVEFVKNREKVEWDAVWMEIEGTGLSIARNIAAGRAMKERFDVLLFLAGDIGFKDDDCSGTVKRVLSHFEREETMIVGGCYLFKRLPLQLVACQDQNRKVDEFGLVEEKFVGTDFTAIRTLALRSIIGQWDGISRALYGSVQPLSYESFVANDGSSKGTHWNMFAQTVVRNERDGSPEFLPEDLYFFRLCREARISIKLDTRIRLQHWGSYNYDAATVSGIEEAACRLNPQP